MMRVSKSMQTVHRLPALSIRTVTLVLMLIVGVMSISAFASESTGQTEPTAAQGSPVEQMSPNHAAVVSWYGRTLLQIVLRLTANDPIHKGTTLVSAHGAEAT